MAPTERAGAASAPTGGASLAVAAARDAMREARDRDEVFSLLVRGLRSCTRHTVLLAVQGQHARCHLSLADGSIERSSSDVVVPLDRPGKLRQVLQTSAPHVGAIGGDDAEVDEAFRQLLGGMPAAALLLPVALGDRVVAIAIAHRGGAPLALADVADALPLAADAAVSLRRLIAGAKRAASPPREGAASSDSEPEPESSADELAALAAQYEREERWGQLAAVLERQLDLTRDRRSKLALYQRFARVLGDKLQRPEAALEVRERAKQLELPSDLEQLRRLAGDHRTALRSRELADVLERLIDRSATTEAVSPQERLALCAELAGVYVNELGDEAAAIAAWQRGLGFVPDNLDALDALQPLLARSQRWQECVDALRRRAELTGGATAMSALLQAADLLETRLNDPAGAAEAYEQVRALEPGDATAAVRLTDLYRALERWPALADVLLERAQHCDDPHDRTALLRQVADLYELELRDPGAAFLVLQTALREDADNEEVASHLERLANAAGRADELFADTEQRARKLEADHPAAAGQLWRKLARWHDERSDLDAAAACLERAARLVADDPETLRAAAELHRKRGAYKPLGETLRRQAELETDLDTRIELYLAAGDVFETRADASFDAIAAYRAALDEDPTLLLALVSLERLYRAGQMWEQLIEVLGRIAELRSGEDEADERLRARLTIGEVAATHLDDPAQAIASYREALEIDPNHVEALSALEQLYERTGRANEYLDVLERKVDLVSSDGERVHLYERLASVWEKDLDRPERAAACMEKLAVLDAGNIDRYRKLVRLYRSSQEWAALLATYRSYLDRVDHPSARVDILYAMAEVQEGELGDVSDAVSSLEQMLELDPREPRALAELGRLYGQLDDWDGAISVLEKLLAISEEPVGRAELLYRMGAIALDELADPERGERWLHQALAERPAHLSALEALARLYRERRDWLKAAGTLARAAQAATTPPDRARLHAEAGRIYLEQLADPDRAREQLAATIALDPEHVEAALPLSELYFDHGMWEPLAPVLAMLQRKARDESWSAGRRAALCLRQGACARGQGDGDRALSLYDQAIELEPAAPGAQRERADLLFELERWDDAARAYRQLLLHTGDAERAPIYRRIGDAKRQQGDLRAALDMYQRCVAIDGRDREALALIADVQAELGDADAVIQTKRELLRGATDDQRVRLLDDIGTLYRERLASPPRAIAAYEEALAIAPEHHQILQKLLDLHTHMEQWKKAVDVIERFYRIETHPVRRGSYAQAAGTICREKLKDTDTALEQFERALDCFFEQPGQLPPNTRGRALEAFREIDEILTERRDWARQEQAYRRMIKRVAADDTKLLATLWHGLGEVCRSRLEHFASALHAFAVAHKLDPTDGKRAAILTELCVIAGPDHRDEAIATLRSLVSADATRPEPYRALFRLFRDADQHDPAWCAASALVALGEATDSERRWYDAGGAAEPARAAQPISGDLWQALRHPDEDRFAGAILAAMCEPVAIVTAHAHKAFGLNRKDQLDLAAPATREARMVAHLPRVLGVSTPEVYAQPDRPGRLVFANCAHKQTLVPAVVLCKDLARCDDRELAFAAAELLAFLRPERYLHLALPTNAALRAAALAGISLVRPDFPVPDELRKQVAGMLERQLPAAARQQLATVVDRFAKDSGTLDMARWRAGANATAHRVGLLLCGDLPTAARMVRDKPATPGGPTPRQQLAQVLQFAVSEEYFAARRQLGYAHGRAVT